MLEITKHSAEVFKAFSTEGREYCEAFDAELDGVSG